MSQLLLTLLLASVILIVALLGMAVGYFFSKKKILKKQCGLNPDEQAKNGCGKKNQCELCGGSSQKKPREDDPNTPNDHCS